MSVHRAVGSGLAAVLLITACGPEGATSRGATACVERFARYCSAAEGDLVEVTLSDLRPTQPSLGYDEVFYRLGRYTLGPGAAEQLLDQWCATNGQDGLKSAGPGAALSDPGSFDCDLPVGSETTESRVPMKTAVVGPGGQPYLTDGHHTLTSFWEAPGGGPATRVRVRVAGNLATTQPDVFWSEMASRGWTWLEDAEGQAVTPDQLPGNLGLDQFANDQYRGVLYFVRDVGYAQDDNSPAFQEFYWGQWLRAQTDPGLRPLDFTLTELPSYLTLVGNVARAIVALSPDTAVAAGRTAADLGRLENFGQQVYDALPAPLDAPKPGKLAYAIAYKASR